jgi:TetR/AcrR family transcriptional regulator, mexCD-oprJ operon repressor
MMQLILSNTGSGERVRSSSLTPQNAGPSRSAGSASARPQRADARRNAAAILDAARQCLQRNPDVSVADIAAAAGVGRITLYGHFKTRAELIDAVLVDTITEADRRLDDIDLSGDPVAVITQLISSSWLIIDQFRGLLHAAQLELPQERIRAVHDRVLDRVSGVIERGRDAGAFRTDLPTVWLLSVALAVMHAAADDVAAGRLGAGDAGPYLVRTILATFTAPGSVVPAAGVQES